MAPRNTGDTACYLNVCFSAANAEKSGLRQCALFGFGLHSLSRHTVVCYYIIQIMTHEGLSLLVSL